MLNTQAGVTLEKYLMICEQMGHEPDPDRFPVEVKDFPLVVQLAFKIYRSLPDVFISLGMAGSAFNGKDISAISVYFDVYEIESYRDRRLILDVIQYLSDKAVERAAAERKRQSKKLPKK